MSMISDIERMFAESIRVKTLAARQLTKGVEEATQAIISCYRNGGKVLICGNGGSAADAQHFAAEFVNRFRINRKPLPAIALTTDSSILTSIGNDSGFDEVFMKQVQAFGRKGDVLIVITTSDVSFAKHGHSANIAQALVAARDAGLTTLGLVSERSKDILPYLDIVLAVPSADTPRIQEVHELLLHIVSDLTEQELFSKA